MLRIAGPRSHSGITGAPLPAGRKRSVVEFSHLITTQCPVICWATGRRIFHQSRGKPLIAEAKPTVGPPDMRSGRAFSFQAAAAARSGYHFPTATTRNETPAALGQHSDANVLR